MSSQDQTGELSGQQQQRPSVPLHREQSSSARSEELPSPLQDLPSACLLKNFLLPTSRAQLHSGFFKLLVKSYHLCFIFPQNCSPKGPLYFLIHVLISEWRVSAQGPPRVLGSESGHCTEPLQGYSYPKQWLWEKDCNHVESQ